jgi:putative ABC transport system permease protein
MDDILSSSVAGSRFMMTLLGVFAGIALVLGAIGVYGVMSHGVATRGNEIGIRMALGAGGSEVARMVVRQGMALATVGVILGLAAALATTRVMEAFLFNVSATDPWTFGVVSVIIMLVGLLASYLPARKASRIDPLTALRSE